MQEKTPMYIRKLEEADCMTEQELKRLSRGELLQMLIAQMEEKEQLKNELEKAETQ